MFFHECGVEGWLLKATRTMCDGTKTCTSVNGKPSELLNMENGVRQGFVMSPLLLNSVINKCIRAWRNHDAL